MREPACASSSGFIILVCNIHTLNIRARSRQNHETVQIKIMVSQYTTKTILNSSYCWDSSFNFFYGVGLSEKKNLSEMYCFFQHSSFHLACQHKSHLEACCAQCCAEMDGTPEM